MCSMPRPPVLIFTLFAAPSEIGLGVLFFLGRSACGSGLEEGGDGELLLLEGSVPTKSCTLFI